MTYSEPDTISTELVNDLQKIFACIHEYRQLTLDAPGCHIGTVYSGRSSLQLVVSSATVYMLSARPALCLPPLRY